MDRRGFVGALAALVVTPKVAMGWAGQRVRTLFGFPVVEDASLDAVTDLIKDAYPPGTFARLVDQPSPFSRHFRA